MIDVMNDTNTPTREQINKRVVAKIRQQYSKSDEDKLTRISLDMLLNKAAISPADQIHLTKYKSHVLDAKTWGHAQKTLKSELDAVLVHEKAVDRLAIPLLDAAATHEEAGELLYPPVDIIETLPSGAMVVTGQIVNPSIIADRDERDMAQSILDDPKSKAAAKKKATARLAKVALDPLDREVLIVETYPKVEELDVDGNPTGVLFDNPAIIADLAERADADAIIKATTTAIKSIVTKRADAKAAIAAAAEVAIAATSEPTLP